MVLSWRKALKSNSHLPKILFFCIVNSPSKIMKNAFYFTLKALFVLKIFEFLSWLFGHVGKSAWLEIKVNIKIYYVTTCNYFYNILRVSEALPNFPSPKVKRYAIITYKHGIYELPHELPDDLRLRILGN